MLEVLAPLVGMKRARAERPTSDAAVARELFLKPTSRRLREGGVRRFSLCFPPPLLLEGEIGGSKREEGGFFDLQTCNGVSVWIGG